jgi:hypothetical protein
VQARLALDSGKRNDDRRHWEESSRVDIDHGS